MWKWKSAVALFFGFLFFWFCYCVCVGLWEYVFSFVFKQQFSLEMNISTRPTKITISISYANYTFCSTIPFSLVRFLPCHVLFHSFLPRSFVWKTKKWMERVAAKIVRNSFQIFIADINNHHPETLQKNQTNCQQLLRLCILNTITW